MKNWTIVALILSAAVVSEAAKGDSTKEEFMAAQKTQHEKKGWTWNQEKMEKMFAAIDVDEDGIASAAEKKAYWADPEAAKAKAAEKAAPAVQKKLKKGDSTKEMFMAVQKAQKEKQGIAFDVKKHEKMFEQMDTDGDGIVTGEEKKAYWKK